MNPDGSWGQKQRREYLLDENGERVKDEAGHDKFNAVPTTDWGSPDTLNLIKIADVLDTEIEYLATGRHPVYLPAPVVVNVSEKVDKIVERVVEKPVIRKVVRIKYRNDPLVLGITGAAGLILGLIIGLLF